MLLVYPRVSALLSVPIPVAWNVSTGYITADRDFTRSGTSQGCSKVLIKGYVFSREGSRIFFFF
jgi:hypothetical protein